MKKISIIIPVYNAMTSGGGYINRCVASVIAQRGFLIEDLEVILINDGSKDRSLDELRRIKKSSPKIIRLINQENMGVANTRNRAIGLATGEYVTFLDQDDWIDEDFCEKLYKVASENNADVVASGYRRPDKNRKIIKEFRFTKGVYSRYTLSAGWAKLHRADFLQKNNIKFFDNGYGEDLPFSVKENVTAKNYQIVDYIGYNWYFNEQSVSNVKQKNLTQAKIREVEKLLKRLCDIKPVNNQRCFYYFLLRTTVFYILFAGRAVERKEFLEATSRLFSVLEGDDRISLSMKLHKSIIPPKGEIPSVGLIVGVFVLLRALHLLPLFSFFWCKPSGK